MSSDKEQHRCTCSHCDEGSVLQDRKPNFNSWPPETSAIQLARPPTSASTWSRRCRQHTRPAADPGVPARADGPSSEQRCRLEPARPAGSGAARRCREARDESQPIGPRRLELTGFVFFPIGAEPCIGEASDDWRQFDMWTGSLRACSGRPEAFCKAMPGLGRLRATFLALRGFAFAKSVSPSTYQQCNKRC